MVDTAVNQVTATIPIPAGPPRSLAFAPDGRTLYVAIFNDQWTIHTVDVIDTPSNTVIATIPQLARPFCPAVTPDGKLLLVPNHDIATILATTKLGLAGDRLRYYARPSSFSRRTS